MKGFERTNQLFSLCGLNCRLCFMFLGKHCGGCGNGNQSCPIAKCSLQNGKIEYCYECIHYPCEKYSHIDEYDSFITHLHQKRDIRKAQEIGIEKYTAGKQGVYESPVFHLEFVDILMKSRRVFISKELCANAPKPLGEYYTFRTQVYISHSIYKI